MALKNGTTGNLIGRSIEMQKPEDVVLQGLFLMTEFGQR